MPIFAMFLNEWLPVRAVPLLVDLVCDSQFSRIFLLLFPELPAEGIDTSGEQVAWTNELLSLLAQGPKGKKPDCVCVN